MYTFLLTLQYLSVIAVLFGIGIAYYAKKSELQTILILLFSSNLINQLGYLLEMKATTLEGALFATRFSYYGKLCVLIFIFLFALSYCKVNIPVWLQTFLCLFCFGVLILVWTCDKHTLYYANIVFVNDGWFPHIEATPGIGLLLFEIVSLLFMAVIFVACIVNLTRAKDRKERNRLFCLLLIPIIMALAIVANILDFVHGYDCSAIAFLIDNFILAFAVENLELVDYVAQAKEEIIDELADSVMVLNKDNELVYANNQTVILFPEIEGEKKAEIVMNISRHFESAGEIWLDERLYSIRKKEITGKNVVQSVIYTLTDNTSNYLLTYVDALTGVKNRRALTKAVEDLEANENTWFVIMDIDNFKGINDNLGHQVGDDSLILFANTLKEIFSKEEVFRYGGDEFVLLPECREEDLVSKLEIINKKLSDKDNAVPFGVSGGYIHFEQGVEVGDLMRKADHALYDVKKSGKGRFAKA